MLNFENLTNLEQTLLVDYYKSSKGNGHDFGLACDTTIPPKQARGVISSLIKKDWFDWTEECDYFSRGENIVVTQFAFRDEDIPAIAEWVKDEEFKVIAKAERDQKAQLLQLERDEAAEDLREIQGKMEELLQEAQAIVQDTDEMAAAESYWIPQIAIALSPRHDYVGNSMHSLEDTINELSEADEQEEN